MGGLGAGGSLGASARIARTGILGGMFNPPHLGHLALARAAVEQLDLDRVLLTPVLIPPHKPAKWDPGAEPRLRMCRFLAEGDPLVEVCTLELERPGPSYTVDTLRSIHDHQPDAELTLILGADMARTLGSWREPREILKLARLAVAERDEVTRREVLDALAPMAGAERVAFLDMPPCDISSTEVRRRVTSGEPVEDLVGADVASYIAENELYGRQPSSRATGAGG
ncbi:MAG TPA: nicotinate (nicotinamide) nucleotide adenylyltransferase [Solirubrobacteraceae bacterium]|jgi:nicotinate-nucleotide adenylyltransferase